MVSGKIGSGSLVPRKIGFGSLVPKKIRLQGAWCRAKSAQEAGDQQMSLKIGSGAGLPETGPTETQEFAQIAAGHSRTQPDTLFTYIGE